MELVGAALTIVSLLLGFLTWRAISAKNALEASKNALEARCHTVEQKLGALQEYGRGTRLIDYEYVDVILFGPRHSGKTSINELWTKPWASISEIEPSSKWRMQEVTIYEFEARTEHDDLFDVERQHIPTLRVRVHDYPGENYYRLQALKALRDLGTRAVLLFVLRVGCTGGKIEYTHENAEYFNRQFVEEIEETIKNISGSVAKALVVFNKADMLPPEWSTKQAREQLEQANREAIHQIHRVFSQTESHVISAQTNGGLIRLLGAIGTVAIPAAEQTKYEETMRRLEREQELRSAAKR